MSCCKLTRDFLSNIEATTTTETTTNQNTNKLGTTTIPLSNNTFIRALSWGGTKWNWSQGSTNKLTYYFGTAATAANCPPGVTSLNGSQISTANWTNAEKSAMRLGLEKWTEIIGMGTQEVTNVNDADLKFYITTENIQYWAQYGPNGSYTGVGIYWRASGNTWTNTLDPGGYAFTIILHELGHALGLAHPHDNGGGSTKFPGVTSPWSEGTYDLNQNIFTVMTYNRIGTQYNPSSRQPYGYAKTPMGFDIATIKYLYGLSPTYKTGNNTYTIGDTNTSGTGYTSVYDAGGEDLIIYNGSQKVTIDLRPATLQINPGGGGYVSKVNNSSIYTGYTISNGTVIENATGGSNDDTINQVGNVANIINGRDGVDTVVYYENASNYELKDLSAGEDGSYVTVKKGSVTDVLYNVEILRFNDQDIETKNIANNMGDVNTANIFLTGNIRKTTNSDLQLICANSRLGRITNNNGFVRIGSANTSFTHFLTNRARFYFNRQIHINGSLNSYSGDLQLNTKSSSVVKIKNSFGETRIGSLNSGFCHFVTNRPRFYFNKNVWINGELNAYRRSLYIKANGRTGIFINKNNGRVGIRTTSTSRELTVNGYVQARGYFNFTGLHECYFNGNLQEGQIVCATGQTKNDKAVVELSSSENQSTIYGVVDKIEDDIVNVKCLGQGYVKVKDNNIKKGDLITSSSHKGFGMKQKSNEIKNYTLAKSLENAENKSEILVQYLC